MILMEQKRVFTPAKAARCTHWSIGCRKTDLSSAGTLSRRRLFFFCILRRRCRFFIGKRPELRRQPFNLSFVGRTIGRHRHIPGVDALFRLHIGHPPVVPVNKCQRKRRVHLCKFIIPFYVFPNIFEQCLPVNLRKNGLLLTVRQTNRFVIGFKPAVLLFARRQKQSPPTATKREPSADASYQDSFHAVISDSGLRALRRSRGTGSVFG